ncbi:hypothetical protein CDIK_4164 [Cucumispora dikerogammari]|nr:hypothetical protein CDIK_4164 [Cucumispora dikerogammari]
METINSLNPDYHTACISADITAWSFSHCPIPSYGLNTYNCAESMNSALKSFVFFNITKLIILINNYNINKYNARRSERFNYTIFAKILSKLDSNVFLGRILTIEQSNNNIYLVQSKYIVTFNKRKCSCNCAFEFDIPC